MAGLWSVLRRSVYAGRPPGPEVSHSSLRASQKLANCARDTHNHGRGPLLGYVLAARVQSSKVVGQQPLKAF
jgi:hypothetical protein